MVIDTKLTLYSPVSHTRSFQGGEGSVVYAQWTNGVCTVVTLIVAIERTQVKVEYEEGPVDYSRQKLMQLFCKNCHSVVALGWLKKKSEEYSVFDLAALETFVSMLFLFLMINLFGKHSHVCLKLQHGI